MCGFSLTIADSKFSLSFNSQRLKLSSGLSTKNIKEWNIAFGFMLKIVVKSKLEGQSPRLEGHLISLTRKVLYSDE